MRSPGFGPATLNPPVLPPLDRHLVAFPVLFGKLETPFGQRDIDDALAALIFLKNDLLGIERRTFLHIRDNRSSMHRYLGADGAVG